MKKGYAIPKCFEEDYARLLEYYKRREFKDVTVIGYQRKAHSLLIDFEKQGVRSFQEIQPQNLIVALSHVENKPWFVTSTKTFFKHLVKAHILSADLSLILPNIRRKEKIPTVYTAEEIDAFLNTVDRTTAYGKRNYAIVLLALRLGIRNCDIMNLKLENLNLRSSYVEFVQVKTSVRLKLRLSKELKAALKDYLANARPKTELPYVFLQWRKNKPMIHAEAGRIINQMLKKANIDPAGRHHGTHSLRSTFASELVNEGVPHIVVSSLLGHTDPTAIKHYVKTAVEDLRTCALPVLPPSGLFAEYLYGAGCNAV